MSVNLAQTAADEKNAEQPETEPQENHIKGVRFRSSQLSYLFHAVGKQDEDTYARSCQCGPPKKLEVVLLQAHRISIGIRDQKIRTYLKKVFSPDISVEASSQALAIREYACGLVLVFALISNENPNFEVNSIVDLLCIAAKRRPSQI